MAMSRREQAVETVRRARILGVIGVVVMGGLFVVALVQRSEACRVSALCRTITGYFGLSDRPSELADLGRGLFIAMTLTLAATGVVWRFGSVSKK
jgi:hypothetical protein